MWRWKYNLLQAVIMKKKYIYMLFFCMGVFTVKVLIV